MPQRIRYRALPNVDSGSYAGWTRGPISPGHDECNDYTGPRSVDNPLIIESIRYDPVRFNGFGGDGGFAIQFVPDNYIPGTDNTGWFFPNSDAEMIRAMKFTNPNRPAVDIPLFLYELKDLPYMVRNLGNNLLLSATRAKRKATIRDTMHMAANSNLAIQFGWLPLISDLTKMLTFVEQAERRFKELQRLANRKTGLRRKVKLTNESRNATYHGVNLQTFSFTAVCDYDYVMTTESWATLRWRLTHDGAFPNFNPDLHALAWNCITGISNGPELETLWNAIPFSWLADYFANTGDILGATRNSIPVTATEGCWMCKQRMTVNAVNVVTVPSSMTHVAGHTVGTWKYRKVYPTIPLDISFEFPFLDAQKWSILGSLFTPQIFKQLDKLGLGGLR